VPKQQERLKRVMCPLGTFGALGRVLGSRVSCTDVQANGSIFLFQVLTGRSCTLLAPPTHPSVLVFHLHAILHLGTEKQVKLKFHDPFTTR
jgi:hypothetical protein